MTFERPLNTLRHRHNLFYQENYCVWLFAAWLVLMVGPEQKSTVSLAHLPPLLHKKKLAVEGKWAPILPPPTPVEHRCPRLAFFVL